MTQLKMQYNRNHKRFVFDNMRRVEGFTLSINKICEILHCTRAYVHHDIQKNVRFVKIPPTIYSEDTTAKKHKEVKTDALSRDYIHKTFLMQEGVIDEGQELPSDWMATVWFNEQDFIKWFNQTFSAFRRTQPATLLQLFSYHQDEAQQILEKMVSYLGKKEREDDFDRCVRELDEIAEQCNTKKLFEKTLVFDQHTVITDQTSKVPFITIRHRIESIDEMNFLTVADFPYTSKATKYFEQQGAICYRTKGKRTGKALYLVPQITDVEQFLMSPSYLYIEKNHKTQKND